ncbi:hypothetical protein JCM15548_13303 [Geofilum rubicundum JCM 15548]|uniref:Uncharacterized protein n=1 Tax=Geofilum rubicundum JCM 15548 TaxID=1236989 RepID=A0A0E9M0A6_9BACT|nr:hypothetical protein JCM15548_13303 [Geofilum rubicundum JCM 15548]
METKVEEGVIVLSEKGLNSAHLMADTIVYSVDIINSDTLDTWADWRLKNMNTPKLVEQVFDNVYNGRLKAYDYFSNEALTVEDIQNIENKPDYARSLIEEIQFEETWLFSPEEQIFHKEVHSFVLAYACTGKVANGWDSNPSFASGWKNKKLTHDKPGYFPGNL